MHAYLPQKSANTKTKKSANKADVISCTADMLVAFGRYGVMSSPPNAFLEEAAICPNSPAPGLTGAPNAGDSPGPEAAQSKQVSKYMLILLK